MNAGEMKDRTKTFALRIIELCEQLPKTSFGKLIKPQLFRSGTSVGANYRAACRGRSKAEFIAKLGIVEEEADETLYWLEIIETQGIFEPHFLKSLMVENNEILSIVVSSIKTARITKKQFIFNTKTMVRNPQSAISNSSPLTQFLLMFFLLLFGDIGQLFSTPFVFSDTLCRDSCLLPDSLTVAELFTWSAAGPPKYRQRKNEAMAKLVSQPKASLPYLASIMGIRNARKRWGIYYIVMKIGKTATPSLLPVLRSEDYRSVSWALFMLGRLHDSTAVDSIEAAFTHPKWKVRANVCQALGLIADPRAAPILHKAVQDSNEVVRKYAYFALGKIKAESAIPALINAFNEPYSASRYAAAQALIDIGDPAVDPLLKKLPTVQGINLHMTIETLGALKQKQALKPLLKLTRTTDPILLGFVLDALSNFKSKKVKKVLKHFAHHENLFVRSQAQHYLQN